MRTDRLTQWWIGALVIAGLGLYYPGLHIGYYGDDFKLVFVNPVTRIFYYWSHQNPSLSFYRPIDSSLLALVQAFFGLNTMPVHLLVLAMHLTLAWLIFAAMKELRLTTLEAAIGSCYMLICEINVMAVSSNDTMSQVLSGLAGCCSLWSYYRASDDSRTSRARTMWYCTSIVAFSIAVLAKESGMSFLAAIIVLASCLRPSRRLTGIWKRALSMVPYLIIAIAYYVVHVTLITRGLAERYDIVIGLNILKNMVFVLTGALLSASTVDVLQSYLRAEYVFPAIVFASTLTFTVIILKGLRKAGRTGLSIMIFILALASVSPFLITMHVSELYVYAAMPFVSILVGIGVGSFIETFQNNKLSLGAVIVFLAATAASHTIAVIEKDNRMDRNGREAELLLNQIVPLVSKVPPNGFLYLVNTSDNRSNYSVFVMGEFNVLSYGLNRIQELSGREDIQPRILQQIDLPEFTACNNCAVLTIRDGKVSLVRAP